MSRITIETLRHTPVAAQRTEHVERKGLGHPDTICDFIMEAASLVLCRDYVDACGRVLHHNIDKGLLVAAARATTRRRKRPQADADRVWRLRRPKSTDVGSPVEAAAQTWLRNHLRFVDSE